MDINEKIKNLSQNGIVDVSKVTAFREKEEWIAKQKKAAAKCEEIVTIARSMVIEHPTIDIDEALHIAEEFYMKASAKVDILMEAVGPEPKESGLVV